MPKAGQFRTAFVPHDLEEPIVGSAAGPLAGLTFAVKDMYDIAGQRTGGGSPEWLAAQAPATKTAGIVAKLLWSGASLVGKTICDEFFYSLTGANAHYGTPINPRAPGRLPGGSSSGSAAAVAQGACDFAVGSDTGGSVRVPAAFCGLYGIRPTLGRVDLSGAMPMAPSFDVPGWFAAGPGVFSKIGTVLLGGEAKRAPITDLIVGDDAFALADPEVAELLSLAVEAIASDLPEPSHEVIAREGLERWADTFRVIQGREIWALYGDFIERVRPQLGPGIRERMQFAASVSERDAEAARSDHERIRTHVRGLVPIGSVLILPTAPAIAPEITCPAETLEKFRSRAMRLTCIAGLSGLPQITVPAGTVSGCPVGLSFIAWPNGDEALLDLACKLARRL
jgi:amidase